MFRQFFKFSFRKIRRNLVFSIINITGLTIGLATSFIIFIYVSDSLSYDRYHKNHKNIYRVTSKRKVYYQEQTFVRSYYTFQEAIKIKEDVPEIKEVLTISINPSLRIEFPEYIDRSDYWRIHTADKNIFNVFSIDLLYGNKETALSNPFSIIISEEMVEKYFKDKNPLGQIMTVKYETKEYDLTITGVLKKIPKTSTFNPGFLLSGELARKFNQESLTKYGYNYFPCEIYILLQDEHDIKKIENKLGVISEIYLTKDEVKYELQNIKDVYLKSEYRFQTRKIKNIRIFSIIGILILLISSINYIILSIAQTSKRTKEIAIRKISGASRMRIIKQVLGESVLLSFIAFPSALVLVEIALPYVNNLFNEELALNYFRMPLYLIAMLMITLLTGTLSGGYIALYLSGLQAISIFKQKLNFKKSGNYFGKVLIIFQIGVFTALLFSTLVIYKQIIYANNFSYGFNKENLIYLNNHYYEGVKTIRPFDNIYPTVINEIKQNANIIDVGASSKIPLSMARTILKFNPPDNPNKTIEFESLGITTYNFNDLIGFEIIQGRGFRENFAADSNSIIINEKAVKELGINNPIGTVINKKEIIGVLKNFHMYSIHEKIPPLVILPDNSLEYIFIRYKKGSEKEVHNYLEKIWKKYAPDAPFEPGFFEDIIKNSVNSEKKFSENIMSFTFIAIFLAVLGLFGFSLFISRQKTKEIGIRKALGASVTGINKLISKQFLVLALIANGIAIPVAWIIMDKWLQSFANKIHIWPFIVLISIITSVIVVILTININIINAARKNPVDTLRYE